MFVWYPFRWLTRFIPVGASFVLFKLMGDAHYAFALRKRAIIRRNMEKMLGPAATPLGAAKKYFENHYLDRLHIFLYARPRLADELSGRVVLQGIETVDSALKAGRGVLLVQPHFGPIQITLLALALRGYDPIQVGYPDAGGLSLIGRKVAFRYRLKYEAMLPAPIIPADRYMGGIFKRLTKPGVVLTTGDRAAGGLSFGEQRMFPFMGADRQFPVGPAAWAIRTGAAYLPTFIIPESPGRFRVVFEPPIEPGAGGADEARIAVTGRFIALLEKHIRQHPHCWHFWDDVA